MAVERSRRILLLHLVSVLAAATAALAPLSAALVERWYSAGLFPLVQQALTPVSNALPFALFDALIAGAGAWLVWRWWRAVRRAPEAAWRRLGRAALATGSAAAWVYLGFLLLWGLNYRREPLAAKLVLDRPAPATADVVSLGLDVASRLNRLHADAHRTGFDRPVVRNAALRNAFHDVQADLADTLSAVPGRPKRTIAGPFLRWTSVDGMVNPFGLEVLVNPDLLPFEIPFVAAHEWAHLAGYADEADANFVGWLTCLRADVPSQYSGWLQLYWQIAGELPSAERRELADGLDQGPRSDLAAVAARVRRGDLPALRRASWKVYDSYLKANRVESGVRSYGAVVTLILRARFDEGFRPVRLDRRGSEAGAAPPASR